MNETTLWRWRRDYRDGGVQALLPRRHGPKGPTKLTEDKRCEIQALRSKGDTLSQVASQTGVSTDTVRRAFASPPPSSKPIDEPASDLVPLAAPEDCRQEREAARRGLLDEAAPVVCEGSHLPFVGALVILPALAATGLIEAAASLYGAGRWVLGAKRSGFYGLRSLVLSIVFACLIGEARAEGLTRIDPAAIGRLLGLDRAPEVKRLRFRMAELANEHRSDTLLLALARHHVDARPEAVGLLYLDGHVRAHHGKHEVPKGHVARIRIAMPAEADTWVSDRFADGLLVWQAPPGASLVGELKAVCAKVRELLGPTARPTICFDRGGWSPKLFAELDKAGFDILTYRKGPLRREPRRAFDPHTFVDDLGHTHDYLLADRRVRISYDAKRRYFACRQITRLDPLSGHQTQVITTRGDPDPALVAQAMFSRWRQENFFRYQRAHYGLDALDAYETTPDDPARLVANPARRDADRAAREAKRMLETAHTTEGKASRDGRRVDKDLREAFAAAESEVQRLVAAARAIPAKVPLAEVRPQALRIDVERKRIMDAIRMACRAPKGGFVLVGTVP